jgi:hypothetical protein
MGYMSHFHDKLISHIEDMVTGSNYYGSQAVTNWKRLAGV